MLLLPHVSFLSHTHLKSRNSSWASVKDQVQLRAFSFHSLTPDLAPSLYPRFSFSEAPTSKYLSPSPLPASFLLPLSPILALLRNAAVLQVGCRHDSLLRQRLIGGKGQSFTFMACTVIPDSWYITLSLRWVFPNFLFEEGVWRPLKGHLWTDTSGGKV